MSSREEFSVAVPGGELVGFTAGGGPEVLLLHGGPGMSFNYLDTLVDELETSFRVASYQQRGLAPSTSEGPFTILQAVEDALAVLDGLGWPKALVLGHSWGGQLALRLLAGHPSRLVGALAVDPLGIVGDGGMAAFEAELVARAPGESQSRARELDERAMKGLGTPEEATESLAALWPGYFADPELAPPMPPIAISVEAYSGIIGHATADTDELAAQVAQTDVRYGLLAGGASPMPWGQAARATAELSPRAFLKVVPGGGHFPWLEAPGCVRAALQRLVQ